MVRTLTFERSANFSWLQPTSFRRATSMAPSWLLSMTIHFLPPYGNSEILRATRYELDVMPNDMGIH